tara:strand:- start:121 stop:921 length:801 start_codon:yes stop_codon:yes gene_type:complete
MFLIAQFKKDFLWDYSYKITFFGQFFSIFLTVFTFFFISKTFEDSPSPFLYEYKNNYFIFAIIGLSMIDLINLCLRSTTRTIREAQTFGYIDSLLNSKISLTFIVVSSMFYPFLKGLIKVAIYFFIANLFSPFDLSISSVVIIFFLFLLTLISFFGLGLLAASFVLFFKQGDPVNFLIGILLSIFSGVVFPTSVLPSKAQIISDLIPLTHGLELIRKIFLFNSIENANINDINILLIFSLTSLLIGSYILSKVVYAVKLSGTSGRY